MQNNSLSYIHPKAKIGENVTIEPFAVIYEDTEIGDNSWIGPHATIMSGSIIGKNCKIHPNAVIGNVPQDLKFNQEKSLAIIGDNTTIRECATVNRGTEASESEETGGMGKTVVGANCLLMAYAHVAHDCILGNNVILANAVQLAGHVEVDYHAIIGGSSVVHQFSRIGEHAMIQGASRVMKDIPPYILAGREPVIYNGVNTVGLKRRDFTQEDINLIQEIYKIIYNRGFNNTQAIEQLEKLESENVVKEKITDFIKKSIKEGRGIIRGIKLGHH